MENNTPIKPVKIKLSDGIYPNMSFDDYKAIDAINHSTLSDFMSKSPAHFKYKLDNPGIEQDTEAQRIGRLIHTCALEYDLFKRTYVQSPTGWKKYADFLTKKTIETLTEKPDHLYRSNTLAHKEIMVIFNAEMNQLLGEGNWEALSKSDWDLVMGIKNSLEKIKNYDMLIGNAQKELSIVWTDSDTNLQLKARIDADSDKDGYFSDLKSTKDASPYSWLYDFRKLYKNSCAMYIDGMDAVKNTKHKAFVYLAVEKEEPYFVQPYYIRANNDFVELGRRWYKEAIQKYDACLQTDKWNGYYDADNDSYDMYEIPSPTFNID